jgi:periplasmic protein TonB
MRFAFTIIAFLVFSSIAFSQSGRRTRTATPAPAPVPAAESTPTPAPPTDTTALPRVTAEKNHDYRCTDDGTLAHLLDSDSQAAKGYTLKEVDTKAEITDRPNPRYTKEARTANVQGYVVLKVLLAANGEISRVRVVRRLPYGLTENAITAACRIKFKPAQKGGGPVPFWATVEYAFSLSSSSIFGP